MNTIADQTPLEAARLAILEPAELSLGRVEDTLALMHEHAIDEAEVYFQWARSESWALEDGIVKEGSHSIDQGVGVRAMSGERTGLAYSDDIGPRALEDAARAARAIARHGGERSLPGAPGIDVGAHHGSAGLYTALDPIASLEDADKVAFLQRLDRLTRALDPRVQQVMASIAGTHEIVLVMFARR